MAICLRRCHQRVKEQPRENERGVNTINFSVAAKGALRIFFECTRSMAAFLWNLAPGNQSGTYFKIGRISTKKAPGIMSSAALSMASSAIAIKGSLYGRTLML